MSTMHSSGVSKGKPKENTGAVADYNQIKYGNIVVTEPESGHLVGRILVP